MEQKEYLTFFLLVSPELSKAAKAEGRVTRGMVTPSLQGEGEVQGDGLFQNPKHADELKRGVARAAQGEGKLRSCLSPTPKSSSPSLFPHSAEEVLRGGPGCRYGCI